MRETSLPGPKWLIVVIAVLSVLAAPGAALAAQMTATLTTRSYATAQFAHNSITVQVDTQFLVDGSAVGIEQIQDEAADLILDESALRGYTVLVALPPSVGAKIGEVAGDVIIIPTIGRLQAAAPDQIGSAAEIFDPFWFRNQWMVRLRVWPVRWDPATQEVFLMPEIRVRLDLTGQWHKLEPPLPDPYWEPFYRRLLVNYEDGLHWRLKPTPTSFNLAGPAPTTGAWRLRLTVRQQGLHRIDFADLTAAGIDVAALTPGHLQMYAGVEPIPALVLGEEDGRFDPGDTIIFYASAAEPSFDGAYAYWLMPGTAPGLRVSARPSSDASVLLPGYDDTLRLEEQNIYFSDRQSAGDHWFWATIRPQRTGSGSRSISFDLLPVKWGPVNATLRLRLMGAETGTTAVRVTINGFLADSFTVTDQQSLLREVTFPHFMLRDGANEAVIAVERVGDLTNAVILDWLEVDYVRQFTARAGRLRFKMNWPGAWRILLDGFDSAPVVWDVSDPLRPVMIENLSAENAGTGAQQFAFGNVSDSLPVFEAAALAAMPRPALTLVPPAQRLDSPELQADHIIIAPAEFLAPAERLAQHRRAQGLRSRVVPLQTIYDDFNGGNADPEAIRAFVQQTLITWQTPAPAYLLFFGDGHYDPRQYQTATPIRVPVALRSVDPWLKEVADENYFAALVGKDAVPDIMMGRLPAQTVTEAEMLVDKLISYDTLAPDEDWRTNFVLTADNPDTAGDFHALADKAAGIVTPTLVPAPFYLGRTHASADALREDMLASWNQGAPIINYIGHGQPDAWAGEQILNRSHLPVLQNTGKPGILLSMASLTDIFYQPNSRSLQEDLLLLPDGRGVAGYVASTGYGLSAGNAMLNDGFLAAVMYDQVELLGDAMLLGKLNLYRNTYSYSEFLVQLYALFGDPASRLPDLPRPNAIYFPTVARSP